MGELSAVELPSASVWGYQTAYIEPSELLERVVAETVKAIGEYAVLPEGPCLCTNAPGYKRVFAEIPLTAELLDQLMNGRTGYRAHYAASVEAGEQFNRLLVESVAPIIVRNDCLYRNKFSPELCKASLLGPYSKFWFTTQLTDPSAQNQLLRCPEVIRFPRWLAYWHAKPQPRKGLLAPKPEQVSVLLNGSFVNQMGQFYEQKPSRSTELFEHGWT